jgi:hypothetical protein
VGDVAVDVVVDGAQGGAEFGWDLGLVGGQHRRRSRLCSLV